MPQIVVTIDSKTYRMACGEGEEEHLLALAAEIDRRVGQLRGSFGEIGDLRLTVMTAMMIADELMDARRRLDELAGGSPSAGNGGAEDVLRRERAAMAAVLERAAAAVEAAERRLRNGGDEPPA